MSHLSQPSHPQAPPAPGPGLCGEPWGSTGRSRQPQGALSERLHVGNHIKTPPNANRNSVRAEEMQTPHNCKYTQGAHPMLNPPGWPPKPPKMFPSPGAHGAASDGAEGGRRRCSAVFSVAEKWFVGWGLVGLFFFKPHLHIIHPFVPLQTHPHTHHSQAASQQGPTLLRKSTGPEAKLAFLSPKQAIISCTTMQI